MTRGFPLETKENAELGYDLELGDEHKPGKTYYCTICGLNPVDAENGYDTCKACLARQ